MKKIFYFAALALGTFLIAFCSRQGAGDVAKFRTVNDSVAYVGMQQCRSCHADVYDTYMQTGMGRSFDWASHEKSDAVFDHHSLVYDSVLNFYYKPFFKDSVLYIKEFRLENGDTVHSRIEKVSYIIGSGQHTNSHLLDINGYLFQAPITFYTQTQKWDLAPGFENGANSRFNRIIASECLTCHNHLPTQQVGSENKFLEVPRGIECERCHGPGALHVQEKLAGILVDTAKMVDYSIVNPRHLPRDYQMDLCQRCHLQGIAVLNEGKSFYDFKPGMRLSEIMQVFLPRYQNSNERFIMASQADRLRLSNCFLKSEDLSCITCHNPHKSIKSTDKSVYNKACQNCHDSPKKVLCSAPAAERKAQSDNCVGCHMPRSGSIDIPHVTITDHYMAKDNIKGKPKMPDGKGNAFLGLQCLTKPNASDLEMAQGYLALYEKFVSEPVMLDSANYYLNKSKAKAIQKFNTKVHLLYLKGAYNDLLLESPLVAVADIKDAWTAYRIGEAYFKLNDFRQAALYFERAVKLMPYQLDFRQKHGIVLVQLQSYPKALETFQFILQENPKHAVALQNMGYLNALQGKFDIAERYYDQALSLNPDYEQALVNKAALRLLKKDNKNAELLLKRVLKINPNNLEAQAALGRSKM